MLRRKGLWGSELELVSLECFMTSKNHVFPLSFVLLNALLFCGKAEAASPPGGALGGATTMIFSGPTVWTYLTIDEKTQENRMRAALKKLAMAASVAGAYLEGEDILSPDSLYAGTEELRQFERYRHYVVEVLLRSHWSLVRVSLVKPSERLSTYGEEENPIFDVIPRETFLKNHYADKVRSNRVVVGEDEDHQQIVEERSVTHLDIVLEQFLEEYPQRTLDVSARWLVEADCSSGLCGSEIDGRGIGLMGILE